MKCIKCSAEIDVGMKFCPYCGAVVEQPTVAKGISPPTAEMSADGGNNSAAEVEKKRKPAYTRWWFWLIMVLAALQTYVFVHNTRLNCFAMIAHSPQKCKCFFYIC